jgi:hypothetical protein
VWDGLNEGEKENWDFAFGRRFLVTYCSYEDAERKRMRLWKMGNPPVLLHDRIFNFPKLNLDWDFGSFEVENVDERFIVLRNYETLHFISTETFEEIRTVGINHQWHYDRGLFFQSYDDEFAYPV